MLSPPSSLPGHSDSPNARDRLLPVSSGLQTADRRWSSPERQESAETPGSQVLPFYHVHRMPMALLRVPCRCKSPLLPCKQRPSPQTYGVGV